MPVTDSYVLIALELLLIGFSLYAAIRDVRIHVLEQGGGVTAEVIRGEKSMTPLYTVYGGALASCLWLIDKVPDLEGYKVSVIVVNFLCLTYLFFFSSWFRNAIFFRLAARVRKD